MRLPRRLTAQWLARLDDPSLLQAAELIRQQQRWLMQVPGLRAACERIERVRWEFTKRGWQWQEDPSAPSGPDLPPEGPAVPLIRTMEHNADRIRQHLNTPLPDETRRLLQEVEEELRVAVEFPGNLHHSLRK